MNKILITTLLFTQLMNFSCAQSEEEKNEMYKEKAIAVAKEFTEAIYHGDYEKAQSLAYDYNAGKIPSAGMYLSDDYLVNNILSKVKKECMGKKRCAPIDPEWIFEMLNVRNDHFPTKDGGHILSYDFFYTCKKGFYNIVSVTEYFTKNAALSDDHKTFKVSYVALNFELFCYRPVSELNSSENDK